MSGDNINLIYSYVVEEEDGVLTAIIYSRDSEGVVTEVDRVPHDEIHNKMNELNNGGN